MVPGEISYNAAISACEKGESRSMPTKRARKRANRRNRRCSEVDEVEETRTLFHSLLDSFPGDFMPELRVESSQWLTVDEFRPEFKMLLEMADTLTAPRFAYTRSVASVVRSAPSLWQSS